MGRLEAESEMSADRRGLQGRSTGVPRRLASALLLQDQAGSQPLRSLYLLSLPRGLSNLALAQERCHPAGV